MDGRLSEARPAAATSLLRVPELDGLRAIAALGIVVFHSGFQDRLYWLWPLVDLFFVLSGYLITSLLLQGPRDTGTYLRRFWARRILRIWPVYFLGLLSVLAILAIKPLLNGKPNAPYEGLWSSLLFLQFTDLYIWPRPLAAVEANFMPWWGHSWSLAVEEQFYMLWPLLLLALRSRPARLLPVCVLLLVAALVARSLGVAQFLLLTRMDGLALGAVIAVLAHDCVGVSPLQRSRIYAAAALLAAGPVLAYVLFGWSLPVYQSPSTVSPHPLLVSAFSLLFFALVGIIVTLRPRSLRWLAQPALVWLGLISYAVYMLHLQITGVVGMVARMVGFGGPEAAPLRLVVTILLCIVAGALVRWLVELPLDRLKRRVPWG
ncbi:MAG TPA: acyltransferase [Solimonas sp.]|nr:acyltransferase [Solimonas sp.]